MSLKIFQFIPGDDCSKCPWYIYRPCTEHRVLFGSIFPKPGEPLVNCSAQYRPDGIDQIVKEIQ